MQLLLRFLLFRFYLDAYSNSIYDREVSVRSQLWGLLKDVSNGVTIKR